MTFTKEDFIIELKQLEENEKLLGSKVHDYDKGALAFMRRYKDLILKLK